MKKIAFIINSLASGGAERVCVTLSNFLVENGYNVTIYIKPSDNEIVYKLDERITVSTLDFVRASDRKFKIKKLNVLMSGLSYIKSLYKYIQKDNPDIIISFGVGLNRFSIIVAKLLKKPIIVSEHTNHVSSNNFITHKILYRFTDIVTVLTNYDQEYYSKFLKNSVVAYNPTILSSYNNKFVRENTILCAGTIDSWERKGFDRMIDVMKIVIEKYPNWKLKIAGRGRSLVLENKIKDLGLNNNVEFLGLTSDMNLEFSKAGIFALPSRTEGLPMVLIEAMSNSCPCVSFDIISGPNEIINNGIDGFLVKDNEIEEFAIAITKLIDDPVLRKEFGENARQNSTKFSIENIGKQWLKMLDTVLDEK